jgi:hypothetical protein
MRFLERSKLKTRREAGEESWRRCVERWAFDGIGAWVKSAWFKVSFQVGVWLAARFCLTGWQRELVLHNRTR